MQDNVIYSTKPDMATLPGGWEPNKSIGELELGPNVNFKQFADYAAVINDFLSKESVDKINEFFKEAPGFAPVSVQGMMNEEDFRVGSVRATTWSTSIAEELWRLFSSLKINMPTEFNGRRQTDWWQDGYHSNWAPVAISPMIRYMKYQSGGQHYAHYDAGFFYPDKEHRTLMSIVLYLSTNETGRTRFIEDGQHPNPVYSREHADWTREANENEVLTFVKPEAGKLLIFDHRMCHDVETYDGAEGDRIIIRGDIIFKAIR